MSECIQNCKLCNKAILSQSITFADGNLVINLPARSYGNCEKYCIILAQNIPDTTTINAPVVFTVGTSTTQYPFVNKDCTPILASQVRSRRLYSTRVNTNVNAGVFKYVGNCNLPANLSNSIASIPAGGDV